MSKIQTSRLGNAIARWIDHPAAVALAILALAIFYLVTLVKGQNWSGDGSLLILHAQNLVEGRHYLDTGYLLNPVSQFVSPYGYPPVFSLLLTPVYAFFGLDLEAFKWVGVLSFCSSLWMAAKIFEIRLERRFVFFLVLVVGLTPYLWDVTNVINADFTFMVFCNLSLFLMLHFLAGDQDRLQAPGRQIMAGVLIGLSIYLAYGTREIGVVLPLTLLTYDIVCRRRISLVSIVALGIFVIFAWLQSLWLSASFIPEYFEENLKHLTDKPSSPAEMNHLNFVDLDPRNILDRIIGYRWALQWFWPNTE
jgi:4-amino-4-deoxy-L-arabinose transferase-like glycosyltransferase